jgi:hypothetical protein
MRLSKVERRIAKSQLAIKNAVIELTSNRWGSGMGFKNGMPLPACVMAEQTGALLDRNLVPERPHFPRIRCLKCLLIP